MIQARHDAARTPVAGDRQPLLDVETARATMLAAVTPPTVEGAQWRSHAEALRRVLAADQSATLTMPRWRNSAMDGYAVRHAEAEAAGPAGLAIDQAVPAGTEPAPLAAASAARIFTGAPIPDGADTVVMQEHCRRDGERVIVERVPERGANIRAAGEDFRAGDLLLRSGQHLGPQHVALAASAGHAELPVHRRPRVAVLVTGDELVAPGEALGDGQIHESNGRLLTALVAGLGAEACVPVMVPDDARHTREALLTAAAEADLVLTSGGVSVGDADHVRAAAQAVGTLEFFGVAVKPGKPLAFGRIGRTPLLSLPGNPVSLFVTFVLFGAPLLRRLQGRATVLPAPLPVAADFEQQRTRPRADYLRVRLEHGRLQPHPDQGSGILGSLAAADGLACVPPDTRVAPGDRLDYYPMAALLA
ncbi:MAG: gephyrin-like molybdotransferase Glp [Halofilum sp. (in: g-proteobacteria)]|nr:gephyrin-like molybdotransferase Glp [Halofilum sp. (in: g-proteobacteria)]